MGNKDASATPKGTITLKSIGAGFGKDSIGTAGVATLKFKKGSLNGSVAFDDNTIRNVKSLRGVVATVDYKVPKVKGTVLNTKYDLGAKVWTVGATWDGKLANKAVTQKVTFSNKDKKVAGDTTVAVAKDQKANVVFNQSKVISAKYTLAKGDYTYEPSYNFDKKAPALAVSKKHGKDSFKVSYDLKSEAAALEWTRKPLKVTLSSGISRKSGVGKPTLAAVFENTYNF